MDGRNREFEARLDTAGWGVLFVAVGAVLLVPGLPTDAWMMAVGAVMVGASLVRVAVGLPIVWTTAVVGVAALVASVAQVVGLESAAGPLVLVALGILACGMALYRSDRPRLLASVGRQGR